MDGKSQLVLSVKQEKKVINRFLLLIISSLLNYVTARRILFQLSQFLVILKFLTRQSKTLNLMELQKMGSKTSSNL